jgi:glycosyltransferase involved in cell wall biosynthesis
LDCVKSVFSGIPYPFAAVSNTAIIAQDFNEYDGMIRLLYIANIRLPTEKAHGLQIMQNCEAFADAGADVTLWAARRVNTAELRGVRDVWAHYGVKRNFALRRIPCIDLLPLVPGRDDLPARLIFYVQQSTFILMALLRALFTPADIYYSRDMLTLLALSLVKPRRSLAFEAHQYRRSRAGRWLQRQTVRRVGAVIPVTARLKQDLEGLISSSQLKIEPVGARHTLPLHHTTPVPNVGAQHAAPLQRQSLQVAGEDKFLVAHDGVRAERFAHMPDRATARAALGWPADAFVVGYMGRLHTMKMDKGVGTLIDALKDVDGATLALVGGPDDMAEQFRQYWLSLGLDGARFINAGQVSPDKVPLYLSAFDVCAMPFPWTEHFAYYASPIKLFEYMAARRAIVASDLPSVAEVVQDDESALLVPPGDATALAAALVRLRDDPALRERLAACAHTEVMAHYTWAARAKAILAHIQRAGG